MASETSLNQIVKGAPPPDTKLPPIAPLPSLAQSSSEILSVTKSKPRPTLASARPASVSITDTALSSLPSSPPQIYLNLLILEASLRSQYLHLLSRRRLNTFFLLLLLLWNVFFTWALFLKPREDGTGHGGSVYWVVETGEKLFFMGGIVTVLLVKATGQWERGIRWPRRWLGTTNRGLRGFNLRIVAIRDRWWKDILSPFAYLLPFGLWREAGGSDWHWVEHENGSIVEEDLARGGEDIMLLLLPKNFSSEFRENWEGYRTEYWDRENERRALLRKKLKQQRRQKAKEQGGWQWWSGTWRLTFPSSAGAPRRRGHDLEKHPQISSRDAAIKQARRRSLLRDGSTSRQGSRSSTPHTPSFSEIDGPGDHSSNNNKPAMERVRRGSSVSSTSSLRRGTKGSIRRADGMLSPLTAADMDDEATAAEQLREKEKRAKKRERERLRELERQQEREKKELDAGNGGNVSSGDNDEGTDITMTPLLDKENTAPKDPGRDHDRERDFYTPAPA